MLYKYRSIKDFKYFVDIVLKQRLFAAPYFDLNDPMEGHYLYSRGVLSRDLVSAIKGEKEKIRICSLSREPEHPLMWAHYADGHHGVVVGIDVDINKYDVRPVIYAGLHHVANAGDHEILGTAKEILCHKNEVWKYEQEERVFVSKSSYVKVEVKEIRLGTKIRPDEKIFLRELIERVSEDINVVDSNSNQIY